MWYVYSVHFLYLILTLMMKDCLRLQHRGRAMVKTQHAIFRSSLYVCVQCSCTCNFTLFILYLKRLVKGIRVVDTFINLWLLMKWNQTANSMQSLFYTGPTKQTDEKKIAIKYFKWKDGKCWTENETKWKFSNMKSNYVLRIGFTFVSASIFSSHLLSFVLHFFTRRFYIHISHTNNWNEARIGHIIFFVRTNKHSFKDGNGNLNEMQLNLCKWEK